MTKNIGIKDAIEGVKEAAMRLAETPIMVLSKQDMFLFDKLRFAQRILESLSDINIETKASVEDEIFEEMLRFRDEKWLKFLTGETNATPTQENHD